MRTRTATILILASAMLPACGGTAPATGNTATPAPVAEPTPSYGPTPTPAAAPAAAPSLTKADTPDYTFEYGYPAAAAAIPALAAWLDADREKVRAGVAKDSAAYRKETAEGGFNFNKYDSTTTWQTVTETPRLLSLSATTYDYTGGAHGSPGFRATAWDKAAAKRIDPVDMFVSPAAIETALRSEFCRKLDIERAKRRGAPVVRDDDGFNQCPKVAETTLIIGSTNRRTIDRIGLLVGPYVAGAYAEGSYDLTLPVTPAVLRAVKLDYRDAFATR
ncbi:DUF4163 domain-containing protein [Sphingomonas donggukensis]|uniref:DUF4163 domain-containing protein n=1 Tax=Sphingomonas donggukensis TaxID=2949093 RepID=A0ABY4TVV9_9SPHN|nr:DUF4163 domain-containing protein [Sphingomonas donggukensis]URW76104.1 DUF4163 domain-containing protein [Sphingomonas donggukensis]